MASQANPSQSLSGAAGLICGDSTKTSSPPVLALSALHPTPPACPHGTTCASTNVSISIPASASGESQIPPPHPIVGASGFS